MYCEETRLKNRPSREVRWNHWILQQYEPAGQSGGSAFVVFHTMADPSGGGSSSAIQQCLGRNSPVTKSEVFAIMTIAPTFKRPTYASLAL